MPAPHPPSDFYSLGRPETRDIDIDIDFDIDFFFKLGFTSRLYLFGILQISWGKLVGAIVRYDNDNIGFSSFSYWSKERNTPFYLNHKR